MEEEVIVLTFSSLLKTAVIETEAMETAKEVICRDIPRGYSLSQCLSCSWRNFIFMEVLENMLNITLKGKKRLVMPR